MHPRVLLRVAKQVAFNGLKDVIVKKVHVVANVVRDVDNVASQNPEEHNFIAYVAARTVKIQRVFISEH